MIETSETYLDGELQNKIIVSDGGKKVTSIGKDPITGELVGSTWTLPKNIAAENERILKISLLEETKKELKLQRWTKVTSLQENDQVLQQVVSEQPTQKEIILIDESTGLPMQREIYLKDDKGEWKKDIEKKEEYKYLDSMPKELRSFEDIDIKERPAPIKEDKIFEG